MIGLAGIGAITKKLGGYTNTKVRKRYRCFVVEWLRLFLWWSLVQVGCRCCMFQRPCLSSYFVLVSWNSWLAVHLGLAYRYLLHLPKQREQWLQSLAVDALVVRGGGGDQQRRTRIGRGHLFAPRFWGRQDQQADPQGAQVGEPCHAGICLGDGGGRLAAIDVGPPGFGPVRAPAGVSRPVYADLTTTTKPNKNVQYKSVAFDDRNSDYCDTCCFQR